jgi:MFS family permease
MRSRDFSLFWTAALISNTGTWMQTITVPFVIDQMTHSTVWVGVAAFCNFFPATAVSPIAGSLADRYSRRAVLLWAQTVMMLSAFALYLLYVTGAATPGLVVLCVVIGALGSGITIASWQAFVTQLVPSDAILSAVRLNSMQFTGARAFGPALAGLVLAQLGAAAAFLGNALSFLVVIGVLFAIAPRPVADVGGHAGVMQHFREGLRYLGERRVLVLATLGSVLMAFLGVGMVQLAEPFSRHVLHIGAGGYGTLVAGYGAGAILGSIVTVVRGDAYRRSTLVIVGFALFVVAEIVFGLAPGFGVAVSAMVALGVAQVLVMVSNQTAVQVNVDERFRGRVLSVYVMAFFTGTPVGALLGGLVAAGIGLRGTVVGAALLMALLVAVLVSRGDRLAPLDESTLGFDETYPEPVASFRGTDVDTAAHLVVEPVD